MFNKVRFGRSLDGREVRKRFVRSPLEPYTVYTVTGGGQPATAIIIMTQTRGPARKYAENAEYFQVQKVWNERWTTNEVRPIIIIIIIVPRLSRCYPACNWLIALNPVSLRYRRIFICPVP